MKKFLISYIACLVCYSLLITTILFISYDDGLKEWGEPFPYKIMGFYALFASIPLLIGCLIGEIFYRKIRGIYKLQVGIPSFLLLGINFILLYDLLIKGGLLPITDFIYESAPSALSFVVFYLTRRSCIGSY